MIPTFDLDLIGCVNDVPLSGGVTADVDPRRGTARAVLTVTQPALHWDPLLALLAVVDGILLDAALFPFGEGAAQDPPEDASPEAAFHHHRSILWDDQGRAVGGATTSLHWTRTRGTVSGRGQLLDARFRTEAIERATAVESASPILVAAGGAGLARAMSTYALETDWGHRYLLDSLLCYEGSADVEEGVVRVEPAWSGLSRRPLPDGAEETEVSVRFGVTALGAAS